MQPVCSASIAAAAVLALASASTLAHADCFDEAARYQKVNPLILRAIAWQESHNRPDALHRNANGSTDYGVMQINSVHLPLLSQYGISSSTLMEPSRPAGRASRSWSPPGRTPSGC